MSASTPLLSWVRETGRLLARPLAIARQTRPADLRADAVAGLTLAAVLVPQAMAYALIAELPAEIGLYSAIVGSIVGALWGSSSHLQSGPTNVASLLVLSTLLPLAQPGSGEYVIAAGVTAVLAGAMRLLMGLFRLGVLINFVSSSVIVGFTAGAGILIGAHQTRHLLRLDLPGNPSFFGTVVDLLGHLGATHWPSVALGGATIALLVVAKRLRPRAPAVLAAMILTAAAVPLLDLVEQGVTVIGPLPRQLPQLEALPLWDLALVQRLLPSALALAAIGLAEAMAIARALAAQTGQRLDANQEFVGQGLSNIAVGFLSGYPSSGSLTRSVIAHHAGGRTAFTGVLAGVWVAAAVLLFAPWAQYLPRATLAGVIIVTAVRIIDFGGIRQILRGSVGDSTIMLATLAATLVLPLQFAVLCGIGASLLRFVAQTSMPAVYPVVPDDTYRHFVHRPFQPNCPQLAVISIRGALYFGAAHHVEKTLRNTFERNPQQRYLLLRLHMVDHCDITGVHVLETVMQHLRERAGDLFIVRAREPVAEMLAATGFSAQLGQDHFLGAEDAIAHLFDRVLDPLVCMHRCPVRVFAECQAIPKHPVEPGQQLAGLSPLVDEVPRWSARQLAEALAAAGERAVALFDVREPEEFAAGHIAGAQSIPLRQVIERQRELPSNRTVVLACRSGRRSTHAVRMLRIAGYPGSIYALQGGMLAWEAAGFPVAVSETVFVA